MAPSLRGRLVCFYCGCRSAQTRKPDIRKWQCEKCEAVNHLDENGEITDPPAAESISNARFAQQIHRPTSPVFDVAENQLFCKTCLKNQHIFSESLASYFPSQDAPNYGDYEKQYPKFRKELEERYPQVCEECEPRVRERLRATGYAAKTDHLRRMMERTRGGGIAQRSSGWKGLLVFIGGTVWALSVVGQVVWDGLALFSFRANHGGLVDEDASSAGSECLHQVIRGLEPSPGCGALLDPVARVALLLGVFSIWWNPRLQERLSRIGGRIVGATEYYKLQAILVFARCLAWAYVPEISSRELDSQTTKGIHFALLFFGALLTVMSFRAISIDYSPRVVFQDSPEPLIARRCQQETTDVEPQKPDNFLYEPKPYSTQRNSRVQPFSINDLAPASRQQYPLSFQSPYQPPTPPPDEDDDGAMDWTPSQQASLRPATLYRPSNSAVQQTQQTPFRGHLPADVVSVEHRLRNPPNKPTFRKASESTKQNFFRTPKTKSYRDYDDTSDPGTEYELSIAETVTPGPARFADPKLRLPFGQPDTGLERLLANTFSLDDEPQEVRALKRQAAPEARSFNRNIFIQWHRVPMFILLVTSYFFWTNTLKPSLEVYQQQFRLATLFVTGVSSIRSIILMLPKHGPNWSESNLLLFTSELLASTTLAYAVRRPLTALSSSADSGLLGSTASRFVALMAVQELYMLSRDIGDAWKHHKILDSSATTPNPSVEPLPSLGQPPIIREESETPTIASGTSTAMTKRYTVPVSRSTRSRTRESLGTGFGSLSLDGNARSEQLSGMGSLSLGQQRRRNRGGMW